MAQAIKENAVEETQAVNGAVPAPTTTSPDTAAAIAAHLFMSRSAGARRPTGAMPSNEDREKARQHLKNIEEGGATTTEAVEYLLTLGWSTAAIRDAVRYPSDTRGHKEGDMLLPQHVNAIRSRWQQKVAADQKANSNTNKAAAE